MESDAEFLLCWGIHANSIGECPSSISTGAAGFWFGALHLWEILWGTRLCRPSAISKDLGCASSRGDKARCYLGKGRKRSAELAKVHLTEYTVLENNWKFWVSGQVFSTLEPYRIEVTFIYFNVLLGLKIINEKIFSTAWYILYGVFKLFFFFYFSQH